MGGVVKVMEDSILECARFDPIGSQDSMIRDSMIRDSIAKIRKIRLQDSILGRFDSFGSFIE